MLCKKCNRGFPDYLINPIKYSTPETKLISELMCPLCALKLRNKLHGLDKNIPFTGEIALELWKEAKALYPKD